MAKAIAGEVVKRKIFLHLSDYYEGGILLSGTDVSQSLGYPCIGSIDVEFTVPEFYDTKLQVEALENHLQALNAEHHLKTKNIKDQIQRLLAIGHDGESK